MTECVIEIKKYFPAKSLIHFSVLATKITHLLEKELKYTS